MDIHDLKDTEIQQGGNHNHLGDRNGDEFSGNYNKKTVNNSRNKFSLSLGGIAALLLITSGISGGLSVFAVNNIEALQSQSRQGATEVQSPEAIQKLETQVHRLEREVADQNALLEQKNNSIAGLEGSLQKAKDDLQSLQAQLTEKDRIIAGLRTKIAQLETTPSVSSAEIEVTRAEYDQLRAGMTMDQVVSIIGVPGRREGSGPSTERFSWNDGSWSRLRLVFRDGKVVSIGSYNFG